MPLPQAYSRHTRPRGVEPSARSSASSHAADMRRGAHVGTPLFIQRTCDACREEAPPIVVQRDDEETTLPPMPSFQLTPPSLLQPPRPFPNLRLVPDLELHLSPEIEATALGSVRSWLAPTTLSDAIGRIDFSVLDQPAPVNPFALPAVPTPGPLVPAGPGPAVPRAASAGDLARAALAVPTFHSALDRLGDLASDRVRRDWNRLGTGGQVGVVSALTVIGGGALAGVISSPSARSFALSQLNGRVLPVPGVDWLHLELYTGGSSLMVGTHVDVGRILQLTVPQLGFGPSSPSAIGGPPQPQPFVPGAPIERAAAEHGAAATSPAVAHHIRGASGRGSALPRMLRSSLERHLDADLSRVRVHDDAMSDSLTRELRAHAFTAGQDLFFRAGRYAPNTQAGRHLIAHEAAHAVQQGRGVATAPQAARALHVSEPGDASETQAERVAAQFSAREARDAGAPS